MTARSTEEKAGMRTRNKRRIERSAETTHAPMDPTVTAAAKGMHDTGGRAMPISLRLRWKAYAEKLSRR